MNQRIAARFGISEIFAFRQAAATLRNQPKKKQQSHHFFPAEVVLKRPAMQNVTLFGALSNSYSVCTFRSISALQTSVK